MAWSHPSGLSLALLLLAAAPFRDAARAETVPVSGALDAAPGLDTAEVHGEYLNGNFENVLARLQAFQESHPNHAREDSLFIARHLAVVHSADPKSVEAGKYWMHRLLLLSPAADLEGMYASESIERTFDKVRAEARARSRGGRRKWLWLGAGGSALAAATAWIILALPDDPGPPVVPVDL